MAAGGSISKKFEIDSQEWENHLIIRFPPEIAQKVNEYLEEDSHHGTESRLSLNFNSNLRSGTVKFDRNQMDFSLYDLPCITEVMKTLDNKTVYKVADVSQIIVCSPPDSKSKRESKIDEDGKSHANEWPNGLCPPMKSARQKCFRKTKRKKYMDAADVERELKRLLRSDLEAVSVRWEVLSADDPDANDEPQKDAKALEENISQQPVEEVYDYSGGLSVSESEDEG